jgi:hypothetical protein
MSQQIAVRTLGAAFLFDAGWNLVQAPHTIAETSAVTTLNNLVCNESEAVRRLAAEWRHVCVLVTDASPAVLACVRGRGSGVGGFLARTCLRSAARRCPGTRDSGWTSSISLPEMWAVLSRVRVRQPIR